MTKLNVTEDILYLVSMKGTGTTDNLYSKLEIALETFKAAWYRNRRSFIP